MHAELQAVFDEHANPTHVTKAEVHAALSPILQLTSRAQQQMIVLRSLLTQAELAPHDHALDSKLEMMHQTLGAMEREAGALSQVGRNLALVFTQLDRYAAEWEADIAAFDQRRADDRANSPE